MFGYCRRLTPSDALYTVQEQTSKAMQRHNHAHPKKTATNLEK